MCDETTDRKEWLDVLTSPGFLQLCVGPMFAGKTTHLLNLIKHFNNELIDFLVIKPKLDNRYSEKQEIMSHDKIAHPCIAVEKLSDIQINDMKQYILVEEGQFFSDLYEMVENWLEEGRYIYVAGLIGDSKQQAFGDITDLMPIADEIKHLQARCACGKLASFTSLYVNINDDTDNNSQILIGGADLYKATCRQCYNDNYDLIIN